MHDFSASPTYSPSIWKATGRSGLQRRARLIMERPGCCARAAAGAVRGQHLAERQERAEVMTCCAGRNVKPGVEAGLRVGVHRAVAQVGPRRGIRDDAQEHGVRARPSGSRSLIAGCRRSVSR